MKLKRNFINITIFILCLSLNAQNINIRGGLNLSNIYKEDNLGVYSDLLKLNPGYHFGCLADIPINNFFALESGIIYSSKGYKLETYEVGITTTVKQYLYYLDIPLNIRIYSQIDEKISVQVTLGAFAGYGITGTTKTRISGYGQEYTEREGISWGNDEVNDDYKRPDMGLTFGGGLEINFISIGFYYDYGLANISSFQNNGAKINTKVFKVSLGYIFKL